MSYFDPKIYCKQNLNEQDRKEFDWWYEFIMSAVDSFVANQGIREFEMPDFLRNILADIEDEIIDELKDSIANKFNNLIVGTIDNYPEDTYIKEIEEPELYGDELEE